MSNKSTVTPEVHKIRALALNTCMEAYGLRNVDLVNAGCGSAGEISEFRNENSKRRKLTPYVIDRLYDNVFKAKGVRKEYLYADSKKDLACMTQEEYENSLAFKDTFTDALKMQVAKATILSEAVHDICAAENIPEPAITEFIKDMPLLTKQLEEEVNKIAWSYLHRDKSPLWSYVDSLKQNKDKS